MAKFIEVEIEGKKELLNTNLIEFIHAHEGKTILRLLPNSLGRPAITINKNYEDIKDLFLQ